MKTPLQPFNEELRLKDLLSYHILDTDEEKEFDDLTTLAAQICGCETATISFIDRDRQWFKSRKNVPVRQTSRENSFCGHTILQQKVLIVNDAKKDERFHDNPQVTGGLQIAFYAGAPIVSSSGYALGTICVIDKTARQGLLADQENALQIIARQITRLLELGLKNRQIIEKSEALIATEKKAMMTSIESQEEKNIFIATELHENYAQTLTAIKLYIEFAQQTKDMADLFLNKSKERLLAVINEIKSLSKTISPTTLYDGDYFLLIESLAKHYSKEHQMNVQFSHDEEFEGTDTKTGIKLYRIIEQQLKIAKSAGATDVEIELRKNKKLSLLFRYNSTVELINIEKDTLFNSVIARADLLSGKTTHKKDKNGFNVIDIKMPIA